jgi:hypothetical protein
VAPPLTASQRAIRARAGAFALHAQGGTSTKAGTAAFLARFERQVDPAGTLAPDERARRAAWARKSYMANLGLKASRAKTTKETARTLSETCAPAVEMEVRRVSDTTP